MQVKWQKERVDKFEQAVDYAKQHGARVDRGALVIEEQQAICQMRVKSGNLFGMQGPITI
ncbi:hypothetical protein RIVM261_078980 [Rivularia sp. IAM M-261]|nr:hypothetical protein RIVM261_078980 [Rivularia sp. IAM M-261]